MKKAVIVTNANKDTDLSVTARVAERLLKNGMIPYTAEQELKAPEGIRHYTEFPTDADIILVVGGDGSVIDASRYSVALGIPLLAVNLGKVGYLAEVEPDDLSPLDRLASGDYRVEKRMLLQVEKDGILSTALAVNDVVISHEDYLGISSLRVADSLGNTIGYRADGVIISTPQGSTAYSLSSGGPVIAHGVDGILLTPVCPHSFFNRSVIFSESEVLSVMNSGDSPLNISIDGRRYSSLCQGESCRVFASESTFDMITLSENSMFRNLFRKMRILEDID